MLRQSLSRLFYFLSVAALLGLHGCSDSKNSANEGVSVAGSHAVGVGEKIALTASTISGTDTSYTWSSADESIATVDSTGEVTGVASGETTITVTGDQTKKSGTYAIVVFAPGETVVTVGGTSTVTVGQTTQLTATTHGATDRSYTWASDSEGIAKVDTSGKVTGLASGTATITATGADTGKAGSLTVIVANVIPYYAAWRASAHADSTGEPFNHWNKDGAVPTTCARCHSTPGYQDYIGADGSVFGKVDKAAPIGTVIECQACHNSAASTLDTVTFPSGETVTGLGPEARCMTCHQGNASTDTVDTALVKALEIDVTDITGDATKTDAQKRDAIRARIEAQGAKLDLVPAPADTKAKLSFVNVHYYAAGATLFAGRVRGGYQYPGQTYDWRFRHVPQKDTCVECHDPHSLKVRVDDCKTCHKNVTNVEDLKNVRMMSSMSSDYDGDGNVTEGIYYELDGLRALLLTAIKNYAKDKSQPAICYNGGAYPYFLVDTNGDGTCGTAETTGYSKWTPRLLRAAYNYQVSIKDPGAFAHNAKYIIELLHDSIANLNAGMTSDANKIATIDTLPRSDPGHFDGAGEPARHWDSTATEAVDSGCSRCHGGSEGLSFFLQYGVGKLSIEPDNGLDCATCHIPTSFTNAKPDVITVSSVVFPSGKTFTGPTDKLDSTTRMCAMCHQGRSSKKTLDTAITTYQTAYATWKSTPASTKPKLSFANMHYLAAAASLLGSEAQAGYEYSASTNYAKRFTHRDNGVTINGTYYCAYCHDPGKTKHTFAIADNLDTCRTCHGLPSDPNLSAEELVEYIRNPSDVSGAKLSDDLAAFGSRLLDTMKSVASGAGQPICYDGAHNPYFFKDTDADGTCSLSEAASANSYNFAVLDSGATPSLGPKLLKAAFNYQFYVKEPGAWAHNFGYMAELLYDGVSDLGGSTAGLTRPTP